MLCVSTFMSSVLISVEYSVFLISSNEIFNLKMFLYDHEEQYLIYVIFIYKKKNQQQL